MKEIKRVLVMEDNEPCRTLLGETLSLAGYDAVTVSDEEKGLAKLEREPFNIVVTVNVPKDGGVQVLQKAKALCPEASVVVMAPYLSPETINELRHTGPVSFICKSLIRNTVLSAMGKLSSMRNNSRPRLA